MANMIKRESANAQKDILLAPHLAFTIPVIVGNTGVSAVNGEKIIPAGTPIGGTTSVLDNPNVTLSVANGANAQGVLLEDVDVTNGNANGVMVVCGVVDSSKCPTIEAAAKTALTHIIFRNGGRA